MKKNARTVSKSSNLAANFCRNGTKHSREKEEESPIGVFWDIENCQVPKGKSAISVVNAIREQFFEGYKEAEFMCVCDISKENKEVIQELNMAQVTVVHVNAICKNAADDKLRQCMRRFVNIHGSPSTLLLISADVNFATDLSDFRHRHKVTIILIHSEFALAPLLACAHQHYLFSEVVANLPMRSPAKVPSCSRSSELLISGIPLNANLKQVKQRLKQLSENCGGRVLSVFDGTAILKFPSADAAQRARKRMDKEDIFGHKISVIFTPRYSGESPHHFSQSGHSSNATYTSDSSREPSPICKSASSLDLSGHSTRFFDQPPPDVVQQDHNHVLWNSERKYFPNCISSSSKPANCLSPIGSNRHRYSTQQKCVGRVSPFVNDQRDFDSSGDSGMFNRPKMRSDPFGRSTPIGFNPSPVQFQAQDNEYLDHQGGGGRKSPFEFLRPLTPISLQSHCVELLVTNLDQSLDINKMKSVLFSAFKEHVMVLHISMIIQPDGMYKAIVRLPSMQDAQLSISQLHRRKIGHKRILISYTNGGRNAPLHVIKAEVAALLNDVPAKQMPLFKFRELFENRYHRSISISELYKLTDTIQVCENSSGRMISLAPGYRATPSPGDFSSGSDQLQVELLEKAFCEIHVSSVSEAQGWAECETSCQLPDVCISLKALAPKVHTLLDSHQGHLPLNSFCICYEAEFGPIPVAVGSDWNTTYCKGNVPLEHLVACIPGVEIAKSLLGIKRVQWMENKDKGNLSRSISPALVNPLVLFGREMIDLLKSQLPKCGIPFNKLIPAYHHHFGRQCRVADYGYTKLIDLLEAIPHIIEILGQGQNRMLTLTHKAQVKRFASDLLRVLKSIPSKQVKLAEFAEIYLTCFEKPLEVSHYGVCDIVDLVAEVSENLVVVQQDGDTVIGIPKREQTPEEMERTKQFSLDVIDLLHYTPSCSLTFNKFIPSYHHHFGRQCRVSYYGFSKLIELLEAIPDILEVSGNGEDKILTLTQDEKIKVLAERVAAVVKADTDHCVPVSTLFEAYQKFHGYALKSDDFGAQTDDQLLGSISHVVQVDSCGMVVLKNRTPTQEIGLRVRKILMRIDSGEAKLDSVLKTYYKLYNATFEVPEEFTQEGIIFKDGYLKLSPVQMLGRSLLALLNCCGGHLPLQHVETEFLERFGFACQPAPLGFSNISALLGAFPEYFTIKGRRGRKTVFVNQEIRAFDYLPQQIQSTSKDLLLRSSPFDLLSQPIPSLVPSPELCPEPELCIERNLMGFETPFIFSNADSMTCMSEAEKQQERTFPLCHPANTYFYHNQVKSSNSIRSSPTFAPLPPVHWLSNNGHDLSTDSNLMDRENESCESLNSPGRNRGGRPKSRIAAQFCPKS